MPDACYRINSPAVIYERFDDELVAIHLDKGSYHSMAGSATDAFLLLSQEATGPELAAALAAKYAATPGEIEIALVPFLEQLQAEQLIALVETRKPRGPLQMEADGNGRPFVAPSLQAFHDLEGLLLLDPIHEVGDEGWPPTAGPRST